MKTNNQKVKASNPTLAILVSVALFAIMSKIDSVLQQNKYNSNSIGIVGLEFAGSYDKFDALIKAWKPAGEVWVAFSLGFDFLLIAAYVTALYMLSMSLNEKLQAHKLMSMAKVAVSAAYASVLAGALDITENIYLIRTLAGLTMQHPDINDLNDMARYATWAAGFKFFTICTVLIIVSAGYFLIERRRRKAKK